MIPTYLTSTANGAIFQGDALAVLCSMPDGFAGVCVTSPPYYEPDLWETVQQYLDFLIPRLAEVRRVLDPAGLFWLVIGGGALIPELVMEGLKAAGFCPVGRTAWQKRDGYPDQVFVFSPTLVSTVMLCLPEWDMPEPPPKCRVESGRRYPPFPFEIPRLAIRECVVLGKPVLDPFMGHGTALMEARAQGRGYVGVDTSGWMCDWAVVHLWRLSVGKDAWCYCAPVTESLKEAIPGRRSWIPLLRRPRAKCKGCHGKGYRRVVRAGVEGRNGNRHEFREEGFLPCQRCYPGAKIQPAHVWKGVERGGQ